MVKLGRFKNIAIPDVIVSNILVGYKDSSQKANMY